MKTIFNCFALKMILLNILQNVAVHLFKYLFKKSCCLPLVKVQKAEKNQAPETL